SGVDHDRRVNVPPASHAPVAPATTGAPASTGATGDPRATGTAPADPGGKPEDNGTVPPPAATPAANDASPAAGTVATPDPPAAPGAPPRPPATDTTYSSPGGSIAVHRSGDTISLASSAPAAGFTPEVHDNGPTRVEVRFTSGGTEWRIRVDLVGGQLVAETT